MISNTFVDRVFRFGDYVAYDTGSEHREPEIGRVVEDLGDSAYVCYHTWCTAALTPKRLLRKATETEAAAAHPMIGHHRFDEHCPDRVDDWCYACMARKSQKI